MNPPLPDFLLNFTAQLGASLTMLALGWTRQTWQSDPQAAALQHAYATGVAALLQTFPVETEMEYQHYQSLLDEFFARESVRAELMKLVQPHQTPSIETLVAELRKVIDVPTVSSLEAEVAIQALLHGFESGAYDAEEFRTRLTLKQLSQIGQHTVQQTQTLESVAAELRRLSQHMMNVTFVPTAPEQSRIATEATAPTPQSPMIRAHLNYLHKQMWAGRLILFVGAGVSREAGLPSGWELAEMLATEIDYAPQPGDSLGTIAEYYARELSRNALIERLVEWLDTNVEPGPSHELIAQLRWQAIYTTNYDQLLESGFTKCGQCYNRVLYNQQLHDLSTNTTPLIKLHGCLSSAHRRSSEVPIVITDQDYEQYGSRREALVNKLKQSLLEGNTLLFLGYGLRDPFWQEIRGEVASALQEYTQSYYAIMPYFTPQWAAYWRARRVNLLAGTAHAFLSQLKQLS